MFIAVGVMCIWWAWWYLGENFITMITAFVGTCTIRESNTPTCNIFSTANILSFFCNYFNPKKSCVLLHVTITQHCSVPENDAGHKVNLWPGRKLVFDSDLKLGLSSSTHYKENKDIQGHTTLQSLMIAKPGRQSFGHAMRKGSARPANTLMPTCV